MELVLLGDDELVKTMVVDVVLAMSVVEIVLDVSEFARLARVIMLVTLAKQTLS